MPKVYRHRHQRPHCELTYSRAIHLQRHIQSHHSKNPPRFYCPECSKGFTRKHYRNRHLETVCSEVKPRFQCWFCPTSFTSHNNRQIHMRCVHGRICREQDDENLLLHLQRLSEESNCKDEWVFVESRPIEANESHICPCGQNNIQNYFFGKKV